MKQLCVYAYKGETKDIYPSIRNGVSRFGWSWYDHEALIENGEKQWHKQHSFLLRIEPGDWVVHVNIPKWGWCVAAQVKESYYFDDGVKVEYSETGVDYRHCIGVDIDTLVEFDRNDPRVYPLISRKLKLQGRWWQIRDAEFFLQSIQRIKDSAHVPHERSAGDYHLGIDIAKLVQKTNFLGEIANLIHQTHPEKHLEDFVCDLFQRIDGVQSRPNGRGWRTDHGADVIVEYDSGLPIDGLQETKRLVIQVKSFKWKMDNPHAINQIKDAITTYEADSGLIISTAPASDGFLEKVENLSEELEKPIAVLAGEDFARFVLQHRGGILGLENNT